MFDNSEYLINKHYRDYQLTFLSQPFHLFQHIILSQQSFNLLYIPLIIYIYILIKTHKLKWLRQTPRFTPP